MKKFPFQKVSKFQERRRAITLGAVIIQEFNFAKI